jgi:hypothetical protein
VIVAGLLPSGGRRPVVDVFLSYATEDRPTSGALLLARELLYRTANEAVSPPSELWPTVTWNRPGSTTQRIRAS